jgi:GntR family transcriptional regulator of arabinose operon
MMTPVDGKTKVHKYLQLADYLRQQIADGQLPPNGPLPSFNEMKIRFDSSQRTVEKAHTLLEADGLIRRDPGRGVFVSDPSARPKTGFVAFADEIEVRDLPYEKEVLHGLRSEARTCDKSLTIIGCTETFKHWKSMDGLVLDKFASYQNSHLAKDCSPNMPVVRVHREEPGLNCVMADDASGIRMAVEHLLSLGHKRIGFLLRYPTREDGPEELCIIRVRHEAYCKAMLDNGAQRRPEWSHFYDCECYYFREDGYRAMNRWLQNGWSDLKLTAILAQNDEVAAGAIAALLEAGLRVPEDVSVIGFDGAHAVLPNHQEMSTVVVPLHEIGVTAMKVLTQHIEQPLRKPEIVKLPVSFKIGDTTGPPLAAE